MINETAFELVVNNMKETPVNSKKTFAKYMLDIPMGNFAKQLMDAWAVADSDSQERLAVAFPQCAYAMLEYNTLPEKKREKYLRKLLSE